MRACKACLRARDVTAMFSCARAKDEENDEEGTKMGKKRSENYVYLRVEFLQSTCTHV